MIVAQPPKYLATSFVLIIFYRLAVSKNRLVLTGVILLN